jgi:hypothetical protein
VKPISEDLSGLDESERSRIVEEALGKIEDILKKARGKIANKQKLPLVPSR